MTVLENRDLRVEVAALGAELSSIRSTTGTEYMWRGDPKVWSGRSPVLFPIVGRIRDDRFEVNGKGYTLGRHGFARHSKFLLVSEDKHRALFRLEANEQTRAVYPFEFRLELDYELKGRVLRIWHRVENAGDSELPYALGAHPAFSCDWDQVGDEKAIAEIHDYQLIFDQVLSVTEYGVVKDGLLEKLETSLLSGTDTITLAPDLFLNDARVYKNLPSREVRLVRRGDTRSVTLRFPDFPHLGIWAKPRAAYVCIEPWLKVADSPFSPYSLKEKQDIRILPPGESERFLMEIEIAE